MHYIRFLKSPRRLANPVLSAKITVTTDLGEAFLAADVALVVELETAVGARLAGRGREYLWKGSEGMRALEVSLPVSPSRRGEMARVVIRPKEDKYSVDSFEVLLPRDTTGEGRIVTVRSMDIDISQPVGQKTGVGMAKRVFSSGGREVPIFEETGESIARHIWDAGLVLSSYLAALSPLTTTHPHAPDLPLLKQTLSRKDLHVLELGAGCGIVGITLSTFHPAASHILLTDLPAASDILTHNLAALPSTITHAVLDWSVPPPPTTPWDLILVADCTYNPSVVPDLVSTLRSAARDERATVLLAMKVRHDSELVVFDLLKAAGFAVREKAKVWLPVLAGEDEEIEIFVLTLGEG